VDSAGAGYGPVAGCCEYGDEPLGYGFVELVIFICVLYLCSVTKSFSKDHKSHETDSIKLNSNYHDIKNEVHTRGLHLLPVL
jgi:hypothetical protein